MFSALTLTALTVAIPSAADAPVRLITQHGVELRADEDVFVLFAALNALGYSEETQRKGPPLKAPVFHPIRVEVRDALRAVHKKGGTAGIRKMFDENPAEIEVYLEAILAESNDGAPSKAAQKLKGTMRTFQAFRTDAALSAMFDKIAADQRQLAATLKAKLERDFASAEKMLGVKDLRAPLSLVVVPNPLDGHAVVRSVRVGKTRYLVVGPGLATAQRTTLRAALQPVVQEWVKASWSNARRFRVAWDSLKTSRRITRRYQTGETYLASALTAAIVHRIRAGKKNREADEDFIDDLAKDGNRWGRSALKLLDEAPSGSFKENLPTILGKASP